MSRATADRVFLEADGIRVIHADVRTTAKVEPASVDLVVTSPPYNVDVDYGTHDDGQSYASYLEFNRAWLARCFRWLRDDGRLCLNIPLDKNKDGQQSVGADLTGIAKQVGFRYHSTIIWNEGNISRRTAWGSWMSASAPYVIAPVELIVVLYKSSWKKLQAGASDISRKDFMDWTNGLWTFNGESRKRTGHPAPFPLELPRRCIRLFSFVGDTVLDPFMGSGTTLVAAAECGRRGVGIEIERRYCTLACERFAAAGVAPRVAAPGSAALAQRAATDHDGTSWPSASSSPAGRSTSTTTRSGAASRSRTRTSRKS